MDKIMERIRNRRIKFVPDNMKELQLAALNVLLPFIDTCSARVSALVIVLSDSPCERSGQLETCLILKEDIVGAPLAEASVPHYRCVESDSY
jgi:hypothetical protein